MATVRQQTVLELDPAAIRRIFWSVERWDALSAVGSDANRGFVRHGVERPTDANLKPYKVPYGEHVQRYLDAAGDPTGERPRDLLVFGARNTFQNLGLPGWSRGESPTLLHRCDEPYASWVYQGICVPCHTDGGTRPGIASMSFVPDTDGLGAYAVEIHGADPYVGLEAEDIEFVVTGQPILWDGEVPPLGLLAACTYDMRHIWHLNCNASQAGWPTYAAHSRIHEALMECFMARLTAPATEQAEALTAIAIAEGLAETRGYLHSSVGLKPDGTVILLMMHGSLQEIGRAHRDIGSYRAVLLDNGGSVGVARYTQRGWRQGSRDEGWASSGACPTPEHVFGNGTYFRPRGHSVFVVGLTGDIVEDPFLLLPPGDAAWGTSTDE